MRSLILATTLLLAACGGQEESSRAVPTLATAEAAAPVGAPVPTGPPEAAGQTPAFPGQTRAPEIPAGADVQVATFARGLSHPWGMAFLPDGGLLVTERPGRLRRVDKDGAVSEAIAGVPKVATGGQLGLFDVALDPDFAGNRLVYLAYSAPAEGGSALTVARGRLSEDAARLDGVQVIFRAVPAESGTANIGGRLVFAPDGKLFVTVGDRFSTRDLAQRLDNDLGKVVRINPDGSIPNDNPFADRPGARPEIFSYGHRNPQAAALHPRTGKLWIVEHGARGGDEINVVEAGRNYGWPVITYGEDYSGDPIGQGITQKTGMEQPLYYWDPVIAPSGMAFYGADLFPAWRGSLFVGGLRAQSLVRLELDGGKVTGEARLLKDVGDRIRDVAVGPDGALYVATDEGNGRILKLTPKGR